MFPEKNKEISSIFLVLPATQETLVRSLGLGDSPGGGNGNPLSIFAWRIPRTEEPGGLQCIRSQRAEDSLVSKAPGVGIRDVS